jgi:hypothetical protein
MDAKINRNAPCPCGSGKKYKKCCALKEMESTKKRLTLQRGFQLPGMYGLQKNLAECAIKVIKEGKGLQGILPSLPGFGAQDGPIKSLDGSRDLIEEKVLVEDTTLEGAPDDLLPKPKVSVDEPPKSLS